MDELLKDISVNDLEKLRVLFSMMRLDEVKQVVTLRIFIDEYLANTMSNKSFSYYRSIKISFNYLTSFFNPQKIISSITLRDVESFLNYLQHKINKGSAVYFRNLKAAFNKAKEWGYISNNYFVKVKLPKRQKLAPGYVNSDQLSAISSQIKSTIVKDVVVFAFYTGIRLDEIVNLSWKNVDFENQVITVGDDEFVTKGRKQRFIPMNSKVVEILVRRKKQKARGKGNLIQLGPPEDLPLGSTRDFVFCKENGERFTGDYYSKSFKKACKAAGMNSTIHFHSLRHSFASDLVQKGVPLYTIKELLGHTSITTTEIYSHLNIDVLRSAIEKLDPNSWGQGTNIKCSKEDKIVTEAKIYRIDGGNLPIPLQGGELK